jgi:Zn-dependent peptidase ImmA (M78 family)/transcriptional regulator with XRE-family HTH domain
MFSASRLTLARKRRGLPLAELSAQVGVSVQSLSNYENGRQEPSPWVIDGLASSLKFPAAFFGAPDIDLLYVDDVSFRSRSKLPARKRDVALSVGRLAIEFHAWVDERFSLPKPDLPTLNKPDPETAANMVRAQWGLGNAPISNMIHLLEAHGVRVFSVAPEFSEVDAFSCFYDDVPFVFLNTMKTAVRGRFDAAHELGHLVLHGQGRDLVKTTAEQEANDFAGAFLMPRDSISAHMPSSALIDQIIYGKQIWNVSALALTYRMHDIGMLSDWHYRTTCIELGERGYRNSEPEDTMRETSQLLDKVFRLLRKKGISRADIAAELNIGADDINDFIFGLTMTAVDGHGEEAVRRGGNSAAGRSTTALRDRALSLCPNCGQPHDMDLSVGGLTSRSARCRCVPSRAHRNAIPTNPYSGPSP